MVGNISGPLSAAFFIDNSGEITPDTIREQVFQTPAHPSKCGEVYPVPDANGALWLNFSVINDQPIAQEWVVSFSDLVFDEITLVRFLQDGDIQTLKTGRFIPIAQRAIPDFRIGVPLTLAPESTTEFYLKIPQIIPQSVIPTLMTRELFQATSDAQKITSALFTGFMVAILFITIVLFRYIQIEYYKYYIAYIALTILFLFISDGWINYFTNDPLPVSTTLRFIQGISGIASLCFVLFAHVMLRIDKTQPKLNRLFHTLSGVAAALAVLTIISPQHFYWPLVTSFIILALVIMLVSIARARAHLAQARPLALSCLALFLGLGSSTLFLYFPMATPPAPSAFDILLYQPQTWLYQLAIISEAVFMAMAVAALVKATNQEKIMAAAQALALQNEAMTDKEHFAQKVQHSKTRIEALESSLIDSRPGMALSPAHAQFIKQATEQAHIHMHKPDFGVKELAQVLNASERTLGRKLSDALGVTPTAFLRAKRLERARDLMLIRQFNTVAEAALAVGYASAGHFTKLYRNAYGEAPSDTLKAAQEC